MGEGEGVGGGEEGIQVAKGHARKGMELSLKSTSRVIGTKQKKSRVDG